MRTEIKRGYKKVYDDEGKLVEKTPITEEARNEVLGINVDEIYDGKSEGKEGQLIQKDAVIIKEIGNIDNPEEAHAEGTLNNYDFYRGDTSGLDASKVIDKVENRDLAGGTALRVIPGSEEDTSTKVVEESVERAEKKRQETEKKETGAK